MIKGLTYAIVTTDDVPRARAFYRDTLGIGTEDDAEGFSQFTTREGTLWALMQRPPTAAPGSTSLYLEVDDVDETYRVLRERGVETVSEPQDMPFGRVFGFKDPDGRTLFAWRHA